MEHTQNQHSVELDDRELWFDGTVTVKPENILNALTSGISASDLFVTNISPDVEEYNRFATNKATIKASLNPISTVWTIPKNFQEIDVRRHIIDDVLVQQLEPSFTDSEINLRIERVLHEIDLYEQLDKIDMLRALIYIVNTLSENNVMWGVGRGSSVASYVLYLIGVHDIDSVKYQLDVTDFLR